MTNRLKVIEYRKIHPSWTLKEIGNHLHITRERVRQILKGEGLDTHGNWVHFDQKRNPPPLWDGIRRGNGKVY